MQKGMSKQEMAARAARELYQVAMKNHAEWKKCGNSRAQGDFVNELEDLVELVVHRLDDDVFQIDGTEDLVMLTLGSESPVKQAVLEVPDRPAIGALACRFDRDL